MRLQEKLLYFSDEQPSKQCQRMSYTRKTAAYHIFLYSKRLAKILLKNFVTYCTIVAQKQNEKEQLRVSI